MVRRSGKVDEMSYSVRRRGAAIELHEQGMTYAEIGRHMNIPITTIRRWVLNVRRVKWMAPRRDTPMKFEISKK